MQKSICMLVLSLITLAASETEARTYYLPDYQQGYQHRKGSGDSDYTPPNPECSTYGYLPSPQANAECRKVYLTPKLSCYSCTACDSQYQYDSSNCSDPYVLSGATCGGKYARCVCNTSIYTATYESGCPAGQKIDTSASCSGPSDTTTYYKCVDDPCYSLPSQSDCSSQGKVCVSDASCSGRCSECVYQCELETGLDCGEFECEVYYENCPDKCQKCQDDNCPIRVAVDTPYGCEKYWDDCATKCEVAKSCPANDCSAFPLSSCPPNSICESCTVGCGDDIVHYRQIGCKTGYFKPALYWCMNKPFC